MSYLPLARKYRPRSFSDVVGQDAVITGLTHALKHKKMASAYLLTGTRGIGKTTFARLIAAAVNCETDITQDPCNECDSCLSIIEGNNPDIYEVDGASKTKVEDMRSLLESTQYLPISSRYKVYIIDEVHMLSTHAFNALLKTLEEPQAHIIFVLATTELEKIPMTIRSRCMHYALLPFESEQILKRCQYILDKENITYDDTLSLVAQAGRGSMRDALTILEQVIQIGQGTASAGAVNQLLNSIPQHRWDEWMSGLLSDDKNILKDLLDSLYTTDPPAKDFLEKLLQHWFNLSLEQLDDEPSNLYSTLYDITLKSCQMLIFCPDPKLHLQMTYLKIWQTIHHNPNKITVTISHTSKASTAKSKITPAHPTTSKIDSISSHHLEQVSEKPKATDITTAPSAPDANGTRQIETVDDFNSWILTASIPKGLTGEAIKNLNATCIKMHESTPVITLGYHKSHEALFHASSIKKIELWFKSHLPNNAFTIVKTEQNITPLQQNHQPQAPRAQNNEPSIDLSDAERAKLERLGYKA